MSETSRTTVSLHFCMLPQICKIKN